MKHKDIESMFLRMSHDFLHDYVPKHKSGSQNTKSTYQCAMRSFRKYINEVAGIPTVKIRFEDCTYDSLLDYRNYLHDVLNLSEKTANNRISAIKSYMNYVCAHDVSLQQYGYAISQVPLYTVPKIHQPIIEDVDALSALIAAPPNTKKGLRDKVIMAVLYDGGIRLNELVSLKIRDIKVNDDAVQILLHGKGDRERTDILGTKTSALIKQYLDEYHPEMDLTSPFIYTSVKGRRGPMSRRNVEKLIKKYADMIRGEYDLPDNVTPHTLRRTRGTFLYRDGVPLEAVARKLGHANTQTTRDHYSTPSNDQIRELAEKANKAVPDVEPLWPEDEAELTKILGL